MIALTERIAKPVATVVLTNYGFRTDYIDEPEVVETTLYDGRTATKSHKYRDIFHAEPGPIFAASYAGNGWFEVDASAGMQRWRGQQSTKAIKKAMLKLGIADSEICKAIRHAKEIPNPWCPSFH